AQPGSPDGPRITVNKGDAEPQTPRRHIVRAQGLQDPSRPGNQFIDETQPMDPLGRNLREPPPNWVDLDVNVTETQTGRLMFGVGVNSNQGLVGNATLQENNFDLFRPPRSWQDIVDGTAFRGGGQQFRMEAVPGQQLSRYMIQWADPYFLDQDVN